MASSHHQTIGGTPNVAYITSILLCFMFAVQIVMADTDPNHCTVVCKYLAAVRDADCSYTSLTQIPEAGVCSDALSVSFEHNEIQVVQEHVLEEYIQVQTMLFGYNGITELPTNMFGNLTNLRHLQVNNNNIRRIASEAFRKLHKLTTLLLDFNAIEELEPSAFDGLHTLQKLYLMNNNMNVIPPGVFRDLKNMTLLNINNNKIRALSGQPFVGLIRLEKLYLQNNALTSVDMLGLKDLPIKEIYLDNNNLTTLHNIDEYLDKGTNLTSISLPNNPLHCDCKLEPLRHWLRLKESDNSNAMCATPAEFKGVMLSSISRNLCDDPVEGLTSPKTTTPKPAYQGSGRLKLNSDDTWKIVIIVCVGFLVIVILIGSFVFIGRRRRRDNSRDVHSKPSSNLHYTSVQIHQGDHSSRKRLVSENSETLLMGSAHQPAGSYGGDGYEVYTIPPDARDHSQANGQVHRNVRAPLVKQSSTGSATTSPDIIIADSSSRDNFQDRSGERPVRFSISEPTIPEVELEFDADGRCTNFSNKHITAPPPHHPPPPPPQHSMHRHENIPVGTSTGYLPLPAVPQKV